MFIFYQTILTLLLFISPIIIFLRINKNKEDKKRFIEKFSIPSEKRVKGKLIWFHGASVGEILSILPLVQKYENNKNIDQILITSSTLSSSKVFKKYRFKKTVHQFYPIDHFLFTQNFLDYWKPNLAIFIESEIWPCMFKNLKQKNISIILLNARITKQTFNKWMKIKFFSKTIFNLIEKAYPQNLETKRYLKKLGIKKIKNIGNLKFSENNEKNLNKFSNNLNFEFKKKKIWVASSTHNPEEIFCAQAHIELKKKIDNLITIVIPRHIHRVDEIIDNVKNLNLNIVRHSFRPKKLKNIDIYIVDTFGETKKFHDISSTVFLGGSIIKRGGQNPLEAARSGAKILHGPNTNNFKDIYKYLKSINISKKINTPKQIATYVVFKKNKYVSGRIKKIGKEILKKTIKELNIIISDEIKKT